MGHTFRFCSAGGVDAVEGEFSDGRTPRFVARLLDGEAVTDVCREFGVSRKTGYKIFDRYRSMG
jgi:Homeodomain-like domain